ncbi:MAG: guanylate kinase [Tannerella sp.]|jgi:guanylate kinase|nr:guanylate kinase [Tannerella sp.]
MDGKLIIFSAPSGSGKSTLINYLLTQEPALRFSVSATSRAPRGNERNGVEYCFLTPEEFRRKVGNGEFLEYEEVYPDLFYGTLKSEVERIRKAGRHAVFDVDAVGGLRIKKQYGENALAIFVRPPSIEALRDRLENRNTDSPEVIEQRLAKAVYELGFAAEFDRVIVNDGIEKARAETLQIVRQFLDT